MQIKNKKVLEWIKRYLPAELISIIITLVTSIWILTQTKSNMTMAIVGTWAGNFGYFGTILLNDIIITKRDLNSKNKKYTIQTFLKNLRALFVEFGIAEVFDSLIIRPVLMYYIPIWLNNVSLGVIIAKFTADITFYIPAIISYEMSKKKFRDFE
ncbi:hypothetical protein Emtol_0357 [Emticicia oligotrophica DSM 17448]|uniref:GtrA family protein n=1 Tax=Emticicia oligotrophica (strain DSM 17448 / CIP 109782 / MTCC 6937 / GPTSA100-15) TaxID=929562 RepID=A0ABM5MWP7_EMTOG|nr:hypothetical protein [Emticicia oligotrophica]AFK01511.1 hypothetical protein Emtol_0357 [Emticicia oligotrophica DSM 17448]